MNILREYIRELLTESVDLKIMSMIDKSEALGYKIRLLKTQALLVDGTTLKEVGVIQWERRGVGPGEVYGNCGGAAVLIKSVVPAGLGPLLYDVAIEATGGVIADRFSVSQDAINVFNYYVANRPDIQVIQLDNKRNELTPNDDDNCDQIVSSEDTGFDYGEWVQSSLSKLYKKSGTPVIDELRKRGMLKEQ